MFKQFAAATALTLCTASLAWSAEQPFQRDAAVKLLGYDPEAAVDCKSNTHDFKTAFGKDRKAPEEARVVEALKAAGELGAERAACKEAARGVVVEMVGPGETLKPSVCRAAADGAGGEITVHISEMMNSEHPDVVAAYTDAVARALEPIRDACAADKEVWAKVATQALLFEHRAAALREGRVCALWRLALDKELKAATELGQAKGKAAGRAHFDRQAAAALDGAHHYCGEDSTSSLIDANVGLTKMLIDSMSEK